MYPCLHFLETIDNANLPGAGTKLSTEDRWVIVLKPLASLSELFAESSIYE